MGDVNERGTGLYERVHDAIEATQHESTLVRNSRRQEMVYRLAVSEVIVKKLESLRLHYPIVTEEHKIELWKPENARSDDGYSHQKDRCL